MIESTISSPALMRSRRERIGDEVDRLGRVAGEDDLFLAPGVEEGRDFLARALIGFGRLIGEVVQTAMHVGVLRRVGLVQTIEHRLRLLRRSRVIEIDQRLAVDLHGQDRKIRANAVYVVGAVGRCWMHVNLDAAALCPRLEPRHHGFHQRLAQAGMLDALDRLAEESLDQQRFGFGRRNAARHQIKFQLVVERAGGRAMAALHVVGKDFEFRLVVRLGTLGKQQRPASSSWRRSFARLGAR